MKKPSKTLVFLTSAVFITSLVLAPTLSFAKENDRENEGKGKNSNQEKHDKKEERKENQKDKKEDKEDNKQNKFGCFTSFGHFIAPGWIKHNGEKSFDDDCYLPFGIWKRIHGGNGVFASTTPVALPTISSIKISTSKTTALVGWTTNTKTDSKVFYSLTSPVDINSSSTKSVAQNLRVKEHQIFIGGLTASTTYHALIISRDVFGGSATSSEFEIKTKSLSSDTTAPIISNIVTTIGSSTLNFTWNTNENSTTKAYYSTSTPVDIASSTTPFVENVTLVSNHVLTIPSLATSTIYHVILESKDSSNNAGHSSEMTFTTTSGI